METVEKLLERAEDTFNQVADQEIGSENRSKLLDEGCKYVNAAKDLKKLQDEKENADRNFIQGKKDKIKEFALGAATAVISVVGIGVTIWAKCKDSNDERRNLEDVIEWEETGSFSSNASRTVVNNSLRKKK